MQDKTLHYTSYYISLYTGKPSLETEVRRMGVGYARVQANFVSEDSYTYTNDESIIFPRATSEWGMLVGYAITDHDNNTISIGELTCRLDVHTGDRVEFPIGWLTFTFPVSRKSNKSVWRRLIEDDLLQERGVQCQLSLFG